MQFYRSRAGDVLDAIVWAHYGRQDDRIVELVYEANRGLAALGPVLPEGTVVQLPEIEEERSTQSVRLWL